MSVCTLGLFSLQHADIKKQCEAEKRSKKEIEQKQTELSQELAMMQVRKLTPYILFFITSLM